MEIIKTSEYPIRYLTFKNHGRIVENKIQKNRGGYELLHYYNEHGKSRISAEICNYAGIDFLVSARAELDRADIRDRKQKGFSQRYTFYKEARKVAIAKIEEFEKWVDSNIIWKMTRKQYRKEIHKKAVEEYKKQVRYWDWQTEEYKAINEILNPTNNRNFIVNCAEDIYMEEHKNEVEDAIKRGEKVPEKVLKEYGLGREK